MRQLAYQSQQQTQKQGYYLSLQHMQFMHLLHLSGYALDEYLQNQLEENPLLEQSENTDDDFDSTPEESEPETASELSSEYEEYFEEYDSYSDKNSFNNSKEIFQSNSPSFNTFTEHLKTQIELMNLAEDEKNIALYIIDDLETDGYLKRSSQDIADNYSAWSGRITEAWEVESARIQIQQCDPPGVAARSLQECLLIQLGRLENRSMFVGLAISILTDHFKSFLNRDFKKIITKLNISEDEFKTALDLIQSLNPKPNTFQDEYESLSNQITPAIEVTLEEDDEFNISIINSPYANIRINPGLENISSLLHNKRNQKSEKKYWSKMLNEAHSLIIAIKQREKTMMSVMCSILKLQVEFFRFGEKKLLRPMTLEQVADLAGCDISTVSRITSNKYVQTSHGCYLLKTLFSGSLKSGKEQISSHTVKEMIVDLIEQENKTNPLTDNQIVDTLREKGITIARRTIVKYRDMLGLPNHNMRHSLN